MTSSISSLSPNSASAALVSVVIPVRNEAENVALLAAEIVQALENTTPFEIIFVDDGSNDDTGARIAKISSTTAAVRCIRHQTSCGQSAAIRTGVERAGGEIIVTLDGDGQNNPADISALLSRYREMEGAAMVAGVRASRHDNAVRRLSSAVANGVRRRVLRDGASDTGCGLKVFSRTAFLALPYFDHMHRFLPALAAREGLSVVFVDVGHRARHAGQSNYGVFDRLWTGIWDMLGVHWLTRRRKRPIVMDDQ
ncbi:MAG: glycosyltransferase family 2 protein [Alphaproteobacteria bacterium]